MKNISVGLILQAFFVFAFNFNSVAQQAYNKQAFYNVMSSSNLAEIEQQLKEAEKSGGADKQAMIGTLTMKKAGLVSGPGKKLRTFKEGHKELDASITQNPKNAEYRFMRLMIQENSPGILGYKGEIETDSDYIRKSFKNLPVSVQKAIIHYAKSSKVLSEKDFN